MEDVIKDAENVEELAELLMVCEDLGLKYGGWWEDAQCHTFTIIDKHMLCHGTTFLSKTTDRHSLVFEMNRKEMQWIKAGK